MHAAGAQTPRIPPPNLGRMLHTHGLLQAGYRGQGVRVGVISDGASSFATLARRGVLPEGVAFLDGDSQQGDEGDWMMQIVHQIAPEAALAFCPGGSPRRTVECARELVNRFHAELVIDDTNPPPVFDYPSPKAVGMAALAAAHPDVLFLTGAGNNGGGYYEGRWTPTPLVMGDTRYLAQDFGSSLGQASDPYESFLLAQGQGAEVMLGTSADPNGEPPHCPAGNPEVTLAVLGPQGNVLDSITRSCPILRLPTLRLEDRAAGLPLHPRYPLPRRFGPPPFASGPRFRPAPERLRLVVLLPEGSDPGNFTLKLTAIVARPSEGVAPLTLSYRTGGSAGNSATVPGVYAIAAVDPNSGWGDQYLYEGFANAGPQCLDYARNAAGGWTRLPGPQCVRQPSFVVPDRARVFMPTQSGEELRPFIGDSAAAPAAAGVAALLLSAHVAPARIMDLLERTTIPQAGQRGWSPHYGYGLIDADAAAAADGIIRASSNSVALQGAVEPVAFHPSGAFEQDRALARQAHHGDSRALERLTGAAEAGDADAQTWLAKYDHGIGDNATAARWALLAASQGQPAAQSFLGSAYNRGWGVPMDPRAAQAWWLRAARTGVNDAIYNIGTTILHGRGAPTNPELAYALMRAAALRGMRFAPMSFAIARARAHLTPQQIRTGETLAAHLAATPSSIPVP
jgi:subtilisin family serine protease